MNYFQMTTRQLEQEHSARQVQIRSASPSEYWEELAQLSRVQSLLTYHYQQSEKNPVRLAERATSRR
jgi:hypothetical protein